MIYTFYINRNVENIEQTMETRNPNDPDSPEVIIYLEDNYGKNKNFGKITKYFGNEIVFRGVSPKVNYRKTVSTDKQFHYYSASPIVAAGYTQWDKYRWTFGFFDNGMKFNNTSDKEFVNPKDMEIFCQQVLGEGQWVSALVYDAAKINLYDCSPKVPLGKQNQIVAEENAMYVDLALTLEKGTLIKYQLKDMFNIFGGHYKI